MFRIVHLLAGVTALLLSFIPTFGAQSPTLLQQPDAVYLVIFGLFNLLAAGLSADQPASTARKAVSVLIVLAVALQAFVLLAPLPLVAEQPSVLLALTALAAAVIVQLAGYLPARRQPSAAGGDQGNREMGTVKWFNTSKGFGFISRDSGEDIFVHFRAIRGEGHRVLVEGQRVEFAVMLRDKGLQAEDVTALQTGRR
jgi:CspA family cold shock protein